MRVLWQAAETAPVFGSGRGSVGSQVHAVLRAARGAVRGELLSAVAQVPTCGAEGALSWSCTRPCPPHLRGLATAALEL